MFTVAIFYKYTSVSNPEACVQWIKQQVEASGILGCRILVASEGINGTFEGTSQQVQRFEERLRVQDGSVGTFADFSDLWFKESKGTGHVFPKKVVKVRNEIVATGLGDKEIDPNVCTGNHIEPDELKQWIQQGVPFEIIDMRNDYEFAVGHFAHAHASGMRNFRDLKQITKQFNHLKEKKVLTVCTYGVRCEKASGYLKQQGFKDVSQLKGGIGTYLKQFPGEDFLGSLYVFDDRMTEQFTDTYERIGRCVSCGEVNERFGNCAFQDCHAQLLICESCSASPVFCGELCRTHMTK